MPADSATTCSQSNIDVTSFALAFAFHVAQHHQCCLMLQVLAELMMFAKRRRSLLLLHLSARQEVLTKNDRFKNKQLTNN